MMQWISVEDRLPEEECLAINIQDEMIVGWICKTVACSGWTCESIGEHLIDVTHWMPLPAPPATEKEGE